jgi:hypothetical protein
MRTHDVEVRRRIGHSFAVKFSEIALAIGASNRRLFAERLGIVLLLDQPNLGLGLDRAVLDFCELRKLALVVDREAAIFAVVQGDAGDAAQVRRVGSLKPLVDFVGLNLGAGGRPE